MIPPTNPSQSPAYICLNPRLEPMDEGTWTGDVFSSTWNHRGWCLQENILSKRLLHFCKNKIYFECRTILTSEENELRRRASPTGVSTDSTSTLSAAVAHSSTRRTPQTWLPRRRNTRALESDFGAEMGNSLAPVFAAPIDLPFGQVAGPFWLGLLLCQANWPDVSRGALARRPGTAPALEYGASNGTISSPTKIQSPVVVLGITRWPDKYANLTTFRATKP
jgi:hypothetical protein